MKRGALYADLILPLSIPNLYTYSIPKELEGQVKPLGRVVVQFGRRRHYSALVSRIHAEHPEKYTPKDILQSLDKESVITKTQLKLWEWISDYYLCNIGDVMIAALPSGLRLSSETKMFFNPDFNGDISALSEKELLLVEALLNRDVMDMDEVSDLLGIKTVYPLVKSLLEKGIVRIEERMAEKYKPRKAVYVFPDEEMGNEKMLKDVLDALVRAPAQLRVLMTAVRLFHLPDIDKTVRVKRSILLKEAGAGADALKQLERKGILHLVELEESRLSSVPQQGDEALKLTPVQRDALKQIKVGFKSGSPVLLHGVTSSGKTEVYIQLIDEALSMGKQVLYLLPEIALTSQIISRLQKYFGSKVGVYHSRFNQGEKVETWQNVLRGGEECSVILGARSAVFLPFQKLDLVIVDEEHDPSYKQQDPAPRYNGRDTAVMLATHCGAKVLLGSATPSVETYWNAQNDKYKLVQISERYGGIEMPEIIVTDLAKSHKMKKMHAHFSEFLLEKIKSTLKQGKQVILFRNRRGFSPLLLCRTCGWIPKCANCDVSLTYHKDSNRLRCHYCGYSDPSPEKCLACGDSDLRLTGYGTEKTEEELQTLMPEARIARMDWDTTRGKYAHRKLITSFEEGRIDVLVGTQMVTKGLDFNHVGLVGVLHADHMLHFPDFRSYERSFQLMSQVAGRAGRKGERGLVVIQAFSPKHPVVEMVRNCDYIGMYKQEISDRKCFRYPPFHRLIRLTLRHRDFDAVNSTAETLAGMLKGAFGSRVLGPEFPPVARVRNQYNKHILVKLEYGISIANAKTGLLTILDRFRRNWQVKSVRIIIDVDPV